MEQEFIPEDIDCLINTSQLKDLYRRHLTHIPITAWSDIDNFWKSYFDDSFDSMNLITFDYIKDVALLNQSRAANILSKLSDEQGGSLLEVMLASRELPIWELLVQKGLNSQSIK